MNFEPGKHSFDDYSGGLDVSCDVVVIGGGAGGCAAAAALAEAGLQVAVFEEGRHWRPRDFVSSNPWALRNLYQERGARVALGEGAMPINGGRGVGGSTLINSAISFRPRPAVLADWRARFGFDPRGDFEALVERVWTTVGAGINREEIQGRNNTIFRDGVEKLGLSGGAFMDRSAPGCGGCGVCQLGCPSGGKLSVDRTFLAEALRRGGVAVYADCRVEGAEADGGRVLAVHGSTIDPQSSAPSGAFRVRAKRFVLSGGSIGSPRFLLRAGLAPNEHVGRHLRLHPATGATGRFDEPIRHWEGVSQGYYVDRFDEGYLLETGTVTPDLQYLAIGLPVGEALNRVVLDMPYLATAGAMVHDEDTEAEVGSSTLSFRFGERDRAVMLAGIRLCVRVFFAAGARYAVTGIGGVGILQPEDDLEARIPDGIPFHRITALSSHPMGSCRLGADRAQSVVDPRGLVWGTDNLHIADASIFPTSLGVNPQITTMSCGLMVGREAASLV